MDPTAIHRRPDGSIDTAAHVAAARGLRARALAEAGQAVGVRSWRGVRALRLELARLFAGRQRQS